MIEPVAAVSAISSASGVHSLGGASTLPDAGRPPATDVASFHAMVQETAPGATDGGVGAKLVDAGVGLSHRYADRLGDARELASISPDELGIDQNDYMRAMLSVQVSLGEATTELQSTSQIANSVKDSFNSLYRMQG